MQDSATLDIQDTLTMKLHFAAVTVYVLSSETFTFLVSALRHRCMDPPDLQERLFSMHAHPYTSHQSPPTMSYGHSLNCPSRVPTSGPISERSTCPWYFDAQSDSRRFPHVITRAVLKCGLFCRRPRHNGRLVAMTTGICQPIYDAVRVLRYDRCNFEGIKVYHQQLETIPIAYTCVFPRGGNSRNITMETAQYNHYAQ